MTKEDPEAKEKMDEDTGNTPELNKVTGKKDKVPKFMDDDKKKDSFVQKQLKK